MKTLNFSIFAVATLAILAACNSTIETTTHGTIAQTGDTTITVISETGDTLLFNTASATIQGDGVLVGDSIDVTFVGEVTLVGSETPTVASKVVTKHIPRASESLIGSWVESVVNGKDTTVQGVQIFEGGDASSINNVATAYKNWSSTGSSIYADADIIVLSGDLVEKEAATPFADTLTITTISADSLIASNATKTIRLAKQQ